MNRNYVENKKTLDDDFTSVRGRDRITTVLFLSDYQWQDHDQNAYFDNFYVGTVPRGSSGAGD